MRALAPFAVASNAGCNPFLEVSDDSHLHAGHPGARDGRGHFSVTVVSTTFAGKNLLARHRLVYSALGDLMQTDIHALAIKALTPDEALHDGTLSNTIAADTSADSQE